MKKLETTKKIFVGSVIRVYRKGFGYSKLTVIDNNEYYFSALADEDFYNYCSDKARVDAYLWVESVASYEFTITIIGKITKGPRILFFGHTDKIIRNKERKCLTAAVKIPIKFFTFDPGKDPKGITRKEIEYHTGSIILLSDREVTIRSNANINGSKFLNGHIKIHGKTIELIGKIDCIDESRKIYNVLFIGMHDKVRNQLLDHVFSIYRE